MIQVDRSRGLVREINEAGLLSEGRFAYRSGMQSLRLLDRDRLLSDTHLASRLGYALAKEFFLTRSDVVAAPSIWGAGLAQWVAYFLEPRRPVIYARNGDRGYHFTPGPEYIDGKRVLVIDNLILTGSTMQDFVQAITSVGGTPIAVGALADLSGLEFPIRVTGLLNDVLDIFHPDNPPPHAAGIEIIEVGY
jgi:orotate phosphoribosyltransferase